MPYIPDRCDIVWIDFDPQRGREQAKRRPALVVSPKIYNRSGLCIVCPITSKQKGHPYEAPIKSGKVRGMILCDQLKSFDWRARKIAYITVLPADDFENAQEHMLTLIE